MIWLIGNKGMLGSDVELMLKGSGLDCIASDAEVDITDYDKLITFTADKSISWIINCSAYTAVDKAEEEQDKAYTINAEGVLNIARIAKLKNAKLIHFSTDYVFSGDKDDAYTEEDKADPSGVYGASKRKGEEYILDTMSDYFIIRIAWLYGANGNNIINTMLRLLNERDEVGFVNDQWGSPTNTIDVADLVIKVISTDCEAYGIYHFTNEGKTNWFGVLEEVYKIGKEYSLISREVKLNSITSDQFPTKAKRPANSYLSKDKIKNYLGINVRSWQESLREFLNNKVK